MIKLSLEKCEPKKVKPYFELYWWNIPNSGGMKTYSKEILKNITLADLQNYLSHWYFLQNGIKTKTLTADMLHTVTKKQNSVEPSYTKYFYKVNEDFLIPVALEDKHQDLPNIVNIELEYVKFFNEYGEEYNVKVQTFEEVLEKF